MSPAVAITVVLGEDLLREVLVRLPGPDDLIRAAAACKPFLLAARSGRFLRRFRRLHPATCPRLLGCLFAFPARAGIPRRLRSSQNTVPRLLAYSPSSSCSAASAAAAAVRGGDFALSFLPGGGGWMEDVPAWQILDCRNGRVLLEHVLSHQLAVADPMSRRCVPLPASPAERAVGYGLVTSDGDSPDFRVVCLSRDAAASSTLRALVLSSGERSWSQVADLACQPNLDGSQSMQANQSLYWRLEGGECMVALSTATMEFSLLQLPPSLREISFGVVERGKEENNQLHLLTMCGFCIEVWAGVRDDEGEMAWRRVEKSVRFHKFMMETFKASVNHYRHKLDVVGVGADVVFMRFRDRLFSIDLETMKLRTLSDDGCSAAVIYPYTIAWPPTFLNPAAQGAFRNLSVDVTVSSRA